MTNEWLPCYGCGDGRRSRVCRQPVRWAPKNHPTRRRQPTRIVEGCSRAPAALDAPAKEARHRVTVCPSVRAPSCPFLQSNPSPRPCRDPRDEDWSQIRSQIRAGECRKGDRRTVDEISVRKGPEEKERHAAQ